MASEEDTEYLMMPGATLCNDASLEEMKQQTHDGVIELAGERRISGVQWTIWRGRRDCHKMLGDLYGGIAELPRYTAGLDQFRAFFDAHPLDCALVVAFVEARIA